MPPRLRMLTLALALATAPQAFAHSGGSVDRLVAVDGKDLGDCSKPTTPCKTIAYAFKQAGKSDRIKVAAGEYFLSGEEPLLLLSGAIGVSGGWSRANGFAYQDLQNNITTVVGAPHNLRAALARNGFDLLQDTKGRSIQLSAESRAQLATWQKTLENAAGPEACNSGKAGTYECSNIDLLSHLPLSQFTGAPKNANDIWGFVDKNDGREYILVGLENGIGYVDVTDPTHPRIVGQTGGLNSLWRDVHVVQLRDGNRWHAWAYVSTEAKGQGLQVVDLGGLPNSIKEVGNIKDIDSSHTVFANVDPVYGAPYEGITPYVYLNGSRQANANRSGEWRAYKLDNPANPTFVTAAPAGNGYIHDSATMIIRDARTAQCDKGHNPCEVLIDFNEDTLDLWDVTDKSAPFRLSQTHYPQAAYSHSGWPTEDNRYLILNDELDEQRFGIGTLLRTFDLADLRKPVLSGTTAGRSNAIDHNTYIRDGRAYLAHYRRGLVIYDVANPNALKEVGYFDSSAQFQDSPDFNGAWGVYPFLKSGSVGISDIENGLYLVDEYTRDRGPGRLAFVDTEVSVSETQTALRVGVRRFNGQTGELRVKVTTQNGTAVAGEDFTAVDTELKWAANERGIKTVDIPLLNDSAIEGNETFTVVIAPQTAGATVADKNALPIQLSSEDASANKAPVVAISNPPTSATSGDRVTLNATATDPDGQISKHQWSVTAGPSLSLDNASSASVSFTAPTVNSATTVTLKYEATDNQGASAFATVSLTLQPKAAPPQSSGGGGGGAAWALLLLAAFGVFQDKGRLRRKH